MALEPTILGRYGIWRLGKWRIGVDMLSYNECKTCEPMHEMTIMTHEIKKVYLFILSLKFNSLLIIIMIDIIST